MKPIFRTYLAPTFILNPDVDKYTQKDLQVIVDENQIEFDDLVFTLKKNPYLYHRPVVDLEDYGPMVRGNNLSFKAAKQAGIKQILCDVNIKTFEDKHFSQFFFREPEDIKPKDNEPCEMHRVLFLDQSAKFPEEKDICKYVDNVEIISHPGEMAIEYKVSCEGLEQEEMMIKTCEIYAAVRKFGRIRSFGGYNYGEHEISD